MRYPLGEGHDLDTSIVPIVGPSPSGTLLWSGQVMCLGWMLTAAAPATAAVVTLTDGNDANGETIAVVRIPADTTATYSMGLPGIPLEMGLVIASTVPLTGSVRLGRLH